MNLASLYIAEDGEAVGTLRQIASSFQLTPASVLECLRQRAQESVLLEAGEGRSRLLILDGPALEALCSCAPLPVPRPS